MTGVDIKLDTGRITSASGTCGICKTVGPCLVFDNSAEEYALLVVCLVCLNRIFGAAT